MFLDSVADTNDSTVSPVPQTQPASDRILVIEPGSYFLRIGRATDVNPAVLPHVIARRRKPGGQTYQDTVLPPDVKLVRFGIRVFMDVVQNSPSDWGIPLVAAVTRKKRDQLCSSLSWSLSVSLLMSVLVLTSASLLEDIGTASL